MAPVLGYWNIRGLAQPIRLLLAYTDTEFRDKQYCYGPAPDYDRSTWLSEKHSLGLDFPNLPYYIDGDVKLTQSIAIMRYLGRRFNLVPETEDDIKRADLIEQQIHDIRTNFAMICYKPDFEKLKEDYLKNLPNVLKSVSCFLDKRNWFASDDKPTYVDFMVYECLDQHKMLAPECLDDYQNLKDFTEKFEELPTIKKYMKSANFCKYPLNGDMAFFGSRRTKQ